MASRKDELKKAKEAGEAIVAKKFASDATPKNAGSNIILDDIKKDMTSMDYEAVKQKYGKGKGDNIYFMPKETFTKKQAEYNKNKQEEKPKKTSLVADKFGNKKEKTWADVKSENGNDPAKIADYLNNNPDYKPGDLTKKGMTEMGYKQGEDGKWTIDNVLDEIDNISGSDKKVANAVESFTNPETGEVDEGKANKSSDSEEA